MSFYCINCHTEIIFEDTEQELPFRSQFLQMRTTLLEELRKNKIEIEYNPNKDILCLDCLDMFCAPIEKENYRLENEVTKLEETNIVFENDLEKITRLTKSIRFDPQLEQDLETQLKSLNEEEEKQKTELQELATKQLNYEAEEAKYWDDIITFENNLLNLQEKTNYVEQQTKYLHTQLERTQKINVLNDVFNISAEYEVGTINNLKIGRLLNSPSIVWDETNAALGHVILLISILEFRCKFDNKKVRMKPFGNFSQVCRLAEDGRENKEETYEIFGPPKDEIKFNKAHEILLEAQKMLHDNINEKFAKMPGGQTYELPHRIYGDQIEGRPFKFTSSRLEKWTEVFKYFLTNCKYLIYLSVIFEKNVRMSMSQTTARKVSNGKEVVSPTTSPKGNGSPEKK